MSVCPRCKDRPISNKYLAHLDFDAGEIEEVYTYVCEQCYAEVMAIMKKIAENDEYKMYPNPVHIITFERCDE